MTEIIADEAYVPFVPTGALGGWSEMLSAIDELPAAQAASDREVATIRYDGRLMSKGFGSYPWDTQAAARVEWHMGLSEPEMDRMPAVRHLERIAHELLPLFPLLVRPDGEMAGLCEIAVTATSAMACVFADDGPEITLSFARHSGVWHVGLMLDWTIDIPLSDVVALDLGEVFASRLKSPGSWPATARLEEDRIFATVAPEMFERLLPG